MLGNIVQAAGYHQDALRLAIKMQTIFGQAVAVGNLGMLATLKGDYETARTCYEQHLQLIQVLQHPEAEVNAWKLLADVCFFDGSLVECTENLEEARSVAAREGFMSELRRIHCLIGRARGLTEFANYRDVILSDGDLQL